MTRLVGRICDGTGEPEFEGAVTIEGDTITEVEPFSKADPGPSMPGSAETAPSNRNGVSQSAIRLPDTVVLCPGFIDIHSHADHFLLIDPAASSKVRQGVTTDVIGNCGYSAAPLSDAMRRRRVKGLERFGLKPRWSGFAEYLTVLEAARPAVNVAALAGHGTMRTAADVPDDRAADRAERKRLAVAAEDALTAGAFGVSTGLFYAPGKSASVEEIVEMLKPVTDAGGLYAAHLRDEGERVTEALEESLAIAERSGTRFQYSHVKAWGRPNWSKRADILRLVRAARERGVDIGMDLYPYTSAATDLLAGLGLSGERDEKRIRAMVRERAAADPAWARRIRILTSQATGAAGRRLSEFAEPKIEILRILKEDPHTSAAFLELSEANLRAFLSEPVTAIGSDASNRSVTGPLAGDRPHPRAFGTFPRILARYARQGGIFSLEEAVRRMTSLSADRVGIRDRGRIRIGAKADLVAISPGEIADTATFARPRSFPRGIAHVWVNGDQVVADGMETGARPGRVLKSGRVT
jgi:N-acyl-D-amino-acid deacylase